MTHKDFELIARVLHHYLLDAEAIGSTGARGHVEGIATEFADELSNTNARFDRERFFEACGVEEES